MNKAFYIFIAICIIGMVYNCKNPTKANEDITYIEPQSVDPEYKPIEITPLPELPKTDWLYNEYKDKMTSKTVKTAEVMAKSTLELKPPYDSNINYPVLTIRKNVTSTDVILEIKEGQFYVASLDPYITIKFDEQQPRQYSYSYPDNGSQSTIFINNSSLFINKLKKAKLLTIEAGLYNEGRQIMEFNVDGLDWK